MVTRQYKDTEKISLLGFGCMRLPETGNGDGEIDYARAQEIIDYAYSHGVNYFDTAYGYHGRKSEIFVGKALKKYPRDSFYLATKMPLWYVNSKEDLEKIFEEQLQKCQTDYFDFYLCHNIYDGNAEKLENYNIYDFLQKKKQEGKIKYIGFSFHGSVELLEKVCEQYEWDFAQIQFNYLDYVIANAKKEYEILDRHGIPCIIMEPVRGGALSNLCEEANAMLKKAQPKKSISSWAIRFAQSFPNVITVLSGMSNMEQVVDNVETSINFVPISEQEQKVIDSAVEAFRKTFTIPCTKCKYCIEECPMEIDIPEMLRLYGQYNMEKDDADYKKEYFEAPETARAGRCIQCGACETRCPQEIEIIEIMDKLKALNSRLGIE